MRFTSVAIIVLVAAASANGAIIELVDVGNPGNSPDVLAPNFEPRGAVGYTYQIGKYEVTAGQYTEFLNAVAKDDPHSLYHPYMADPSTFEVWGCNIQQSGSPGNFSYSVALDWANRPVNYVSFWDAARFVNWLSNGQPTGPQGPGTTEDGAYHDIDNQALFGRVSGPNWVIPGQDEWYKAAFHKNDGVTGNYWTYATKSDTVPANTLPDEGNNANYRDDPSLALTIGAPYWRTEVGTFALSESPYGTFDQNGNLYEWNDTAVRSDVRGVAGGSWAFTQNELPSYNTMSANSPEAQSSEIGFRVGYWTIPEPASSALAAMAVALGLLLRRGKPITENLA